MNAIQFIKENGVDKAREVIEGAPEGFKGYNDVINKYTRGVWFSRDVLLSDIKRLVESVYLVKEHNTLDRAIEYANSQYTAPEIKVCLLDAIADYKSIYSDNDMVDCEILDFPEDYTSPNCKKYDERVK